MTGRARVLGLVAGGAFLVLGLAYAVLLLVTSGDGVPRGTTVAGVDIGGLSEPAAVARLRQALATRAREPVEVTAAGEAYTLDPVAAGLSLDAVASVRLAEERTHNPFVLVARLLGGRDLEPVVTADPEKLRAAVDGLAAKVDSPAVEGSITFTGGSPHMVAPRPGHGLVRDRAVVAVRSGFLVATAPVVLPVGELVPTVGAEEVQRAYAAFAVPAVSAPVTLAVAGRSVPVVPPVFTRYLSMVPQDGALVPQLDAVGLKSALKPALTGLERPAVDATFRLKGGSPRIVASQTGMQIPPDRLETAFVAVLPKPTGRVVPLALVPVQPAVTTAQANTLGVVEKVSTFTTRYPYAAYRLQNIHRAANLIDGTILLPGQVFSLNRIVGERTAANGFAIGTIINNGRFAKDYGGGTSQVATTTFNAAFFAGLRIITHKPHSFYISRYPAGREATVAWPDVDLQFQNDSGHAIVIDTSYTRSTVTVTMWGTKVWQIASVSSPRSRVRSFSTVYDPSPACVAQPGVDGFDIDVTRVFSRGGVQVRRETFHTHYNPAAQVYCRADPRSPSPTPSPPATGTPGGTPTPSPTPAPTH